MDTKPLEHDDFLRLLLKSEREIMRYVMAIVPQAGDAQEVFQETAVALWKQIDKYDPSKPFTPWACRFAANKAKEHLRKSGRWRGFLTDDIASMLLARREELAPNLDERVVPLRDCLSELSKNNRKLIEKYYFDQASVEVAAIRFDLKPFTKMWPTASGIESSTESIRFVPPWPKQIRFVQSDEQIFLRPEGHAVRLRTELRVNVSEPGFCSQVDDLTPATIETRQFIRSYILHFSPESKVGIRRSRRVTGSITFARPVLGLIVDHDELAASRRRFGRRGAGEGNERRELNLTGDQTGDRITLSEDRKTVTLDLLAPGRSSDLVRVIVDGDGFQLSPRRKRSQSTAGSQQNGDSI